MLTIAIRLLDPSPNRAALRHFIEVLRQRGELVLEMTRREIADRYTGQALGSLWAIGLPLLLMGVYVFAFLVLFHGRVPGSSGSVGYAAYMLAGLAPWLAVQEAIGRAPTAVTGNAGLVKQIVFPNEILPLRVALGVLPTLLVGLIVTGVLLPFAHDGGWLSIPLLVFVVACHVVMMAGFVYILSAVGVFVRDVREFVSVILSIGMFLQPIFYLPGSAPRPLEILFHLSPVSYLIWCYRDALLRGAITRPADWAVLPVISIVIFVLGYRLYRHLQPAFGNAL